MAESVHWHAFYGPGRTRVTARRIIAKLDRDIETRTARALIDTWGTSTWPIEKDTGRAQHEADSNALCHELTDRFADPVELALFLNSRLAEIKDATGDADYGLGQLFIGRLLLKNLDLARYVLECRLDGDTASLSAHAGRALGALLTTRRKEGTRLVGQMLDAGDTHSQS